MVSTVSEGKVFPKIMMNNSRPVLVLPPVDLEARLLARGYSINHRIGKGGFATVYQGTFNASGELVALKAITLGYVANS